MRGCVYPADGADHEPEPRPAVHGLICSRCYFRITNALEAIPDLIVNMRAQLVKTGAAQYGERVAGSGPDAAPVPIAVDALDASDALYAKLTSWAEVFAGALHTPRPRVHGWGNSRETQGMRPVEPEQAGELARILVDWFLELVERASRLPWIVEFHDDLTTGWEDSRGVFPLLARYGIEPRRPKPQQPHACAVCGNGVVFVKWPDKLNPELEVLCDRCHAIIDPDVVNKHARTIPGATTDEPDWIDKLPAVRVRCTGSAACSAASYVDAEGREHPAHVHGCLADIDGTSCSHPDRDHTAAYLAHLKRTGATA